MCIAEDNSLNIALLLLMFLFNSSAYVYLFEKICLWFILLIYGKFVSFASNFACYQDLLSMMISLSHFQAFKCLVSGH